MNAPGKIGSVVAGMAAGADSIDDLEVIRHGGMKSLFSSVYAASSLGSHLRAYSHGHVRQLESASRGLLANLAAHTPVLSGIRQVCYIDIDDTRKRVYGHAKKGVAFNVSKVGGYLVKLRNLNPLIATLCTPTTAPVIAATRLRGGNASSAKGAASFVTEAIGVARSCGAGQGEKSLIVARMDSGFYNAEAIDACVRNKVRFSVTVRMNPSIHKAIATIDEDAWTPIKYPQAIWDEQGRCWISDAQTAEVAYTAFESRRTKKVTARLIVRRVKDKNPKADKAGQQEMFTAWRHHAVFTDSPLPLIDAEENHRKHANVEQVFADENDGPLAHLPSGVFAANAAWLVCAAITHNLLRAAGSLAGLFHAKARGHTLRTHLINIPARIAHCGRDQISLHLPSHWPWQVPFDNLFGALHPPPAR